VSQTRVVSVTGKEISVKIQCFDDTSYDVILANVV